MAGKVQHEIPQLYQRGFLIPDTGGAERIFVFRKGGQSFPSNINRSGAEGYFYSELSTDGSSTLDDDITTYEQSRLSGLVHSLRSTPVGNDADADVSAEVIAHLTTRNAHLRGAFAYGFTTVAQSALTTFSDEENVRRILGLEGTRGAEIFRQHLRKALEEEPMIAALGIPEEILEKLAFAQAREGFGPLFEQYWPFIEANLVEVTEGAKDRARDGHRKALASGPVPASRVALLSEFQWKVIEAETNLILPDCVALAVQQDGETHPLIMADNANTQRVLLPLTSRTLLVGTRGEAPAFDADSFNAEAASCSHNYFLCASQPPEWEQLADLIGTRSVQVIERAVREGVDEFQPKATPAAASDDTPSTKAAITIPMTFLGQFAEGEPQTLSDAISPILTEATWTMPLEGLDGITIAEDYVGALATLDRGELVVKQQTTRPGDELIRIAQCTAVMRGGELKSHIVLHAGVIRNLLSNDPDHRAHAAYVIANQLAQAGVMQIVEGALPGAHLSKAEGMDYLLQPGSFPAWNHYFASRAAAPFGYDGRLADEEEIVLIALEELFTKATESRDAYREHGDVDRLLEEIIPQIGFFLQHAAELLGHADGVGADVVSSTPTFIAALESRELRAWYADFQRDLAYLWDRRNNWDSFDEFLGLNRHVERLLWLVPIFPWTQPDGQLRIEVPYTAAEVAKWEAMEALSQEG